MIRNKIEAGPIVAQLLSSGIFGVLTFSALFERNEPQHAAVFAGIWLGYFLLCEMSKEKPKNVQPSPTQVTASKRRRFDLTDAADVLAATVRKRNP